MTNLDLLEFFLVLWKQLGGNHMFDWFCICCSGLEDLLEVSVSLQLVVLDTLYVGFLV